MTEDKACMKQYRNADKARGVEGSEEMRTKYLSPRVLRWAGGIILLLTSGFVLAEKPDAKFLNREASAHDVLEFYQRALDGEQPFWQSHITEVVRGERAVFSSLVTVTYPYRSSSELCRAYATSIEIPGWFCNGPMCTKENGRSHHVQTRSYVARIASDDSAPCQSLDFKSQYFWLDTDMSDSIILGLLEHLSASILHWKESEGPFAKEYSEYLSEDNVIFISLPIGHQNIVEFRLQSPLMGDSSVEFRLEFNDLGTEVLKYSVYLIMP